MCTPLAIAGTALAAGGALFNANQSAQRTGAMISARNQVLGDNLRANTALGDQATGVFNDALAKTGAGPQADALTAAANNRIAATPTGPTNSINVGGTSGQVNDEIGRTATLVSDAAKRLNTARANLGAYGTVQSGVNSTIKGAGDRIGTFDAMARGNNAILPAQLSSAENNAASGFNSPLGSILQGLGTLGATIGTMGAAAPLEAASAGGNFADVGDLISSGSTGASTAAGAPFSFGRFMQTPLFRI